MSRSVIRRASLALALALSTCLSSCAINHLLAWSVGDPSMYNQNPDHRQRAFLNPGGTVVAFPAALAWDVATFPFQYIWGVYPFGDILHPKTVTVE
jgi:hypothetical protein